jgi:hypothetical protein
MNRYRILWTDASGSHFRDVEGNSLAAVIWELAKELCTGTLVDTMGLPGPSTSIKTPQHVNLYPGWALGEE